MDAKEMKAALIEMMRSEQDKYRAWLVIQPPEEILNQSPEYASREDILNAMIGIDLTAAQMEALIASATPLEDISQKWNMQDNPRYMEDISYTIKNRANDLIEWEDEIRKSPVYKYPASHARENDELELYRTSREANIACKKAIEDAISSHHEQFSFDSKAAVGDVVEKFGYERPLYVLAATLRSKEHDGRFSSQNKNWAKTIPVFADETGFGGDRNMDFVVESHSVLTDAFVETARHEYLLSLPLTKADIKAEALNILSKFQNAQEPNSPSGTHYMAQISPDFLARASTKDHDRLMAMLPFQSLAFSTLEGRRGTYALISGEENRFQKLVLRRPSVRQKLQKKADAPTAPKSPDKKKSRGQER